MQEFFKTETIQERVLLIGVRTGEADDTDGSLDELEELVKTAGALTVGRVIQNREAVHPTTYIGKGKIDEVRALAAETDASGVVCDDELSPVQLRELEDELQMKVMDRTGSPAWAVPCPVWAAASAREARARKSWRWTGGSSATGSPS